MLTPEQKKKLIPLAKKLKAQVDPQGALNDESREQTENLAGIKQTLSKPLKIEESPEMKTEKARVSDVGDFVNGFLNRIKGEKGDFPEYKKDYLTEEEMAGIKEELTPVRGQDYWTEEDKQEVMDQATPIRGEHYWTDEDKAEIVAQATPVKGVHYFDGEPGESIVGPQGPQGVMGPQGPKGDKVLADEVISSIKALKGNDRLDISNIRNGEFLGRLMNSKPGKKIDFSDLRWHGGGITNIYNGATLVTNSATSLNFTGSAVTSVTNLNGAVTITLSGGLTSPLTTKGDIWGYSTTNARIPVGTNGQLLSADSTQTLGVKWIDAPSSGVTSITGTANQVIASASTGAVTLSLPQSIATTSNVTFGSVSQGSAPATSGGIRISHGSANYIKCLNNAGNADVQLIGMAAGDDTIYIGLGADVAIAGSLSGAAVGSLVSWQKLTILNTPANTVGLSVAGGSITGSGTTSFQTLTGTWNTSGVVDGAVRIAITETASGANSLLAAIYGGASATTNYFAVAKAGLVGISNSTPDSLLTIGPGTMAFGAAASRRVVVNGAGQTDFFVQNTSNSVIFRLTAENGVADAIIGTASNHPFGIITNNTTIWSFATAGHFTANTDNTYDIGASGATRPRTGYFGTSLLIATGSTSSGVQLTSTYSYFNGLRLNGADGSTIYNPSAAIGITSGAGITITSAAAFSIGVNSVANILSISNGAGRTIALAPFNIVGSGTESGLTFAQTWNTSGVVDGARRMAITETAKGAGSLYDAIYGGASATTLEYSVATGGAVFALASLTTKLVSTTNNAITCSSNAATVPVTSSLSTVTNDSAGTFAITITTTGAVDGQRLIVRIYDFSGVAQTIGWTNTENSTVSAPTTSNGSTTLPLTVGFIYNSATTKWRCVASA